MRDSAASMLGVLIIIYITVALLAFLLAERVIFQPPGPSYADNDASFNRIPVGPGDSIAVLHLPNDDARFTILHSHGNAEDLGHVRPFLELLHDMGFGVVSYDYRGYGRSTGPRPSARRAGDDAAAVYQFVVGELGIRPDRLILHGRSVGSGPTLQIAAQHDVAGVILESAFTSPYRVLTRIGVLPFDRFPNFRLVANLRRPVLVIHGTSDQVVPFSHGRALFALSPDPKQSFWVEGAGHNDLVRVAGPAYRTALERFALLLERETQ